MSFAKIALVMLMSPLLSQTALGIITIHFVEEGSGVRVSFSGTLTLRDPHVPPVDSPVSFEADFIWDRGVALGGQGNQSGAIAFVNFLPPMGEQPTMGDLAGPSDEAFGYLGPTIIWSDRHVTAIGPGVDLGGNIIEGVFVKELTVDPTLDTFVMPNQTMESLNLDHPQLAEGYVMWTTAGPPPNDTIVFSRIAPVIPTEPLELSTISFVVSDGRPGIELELPSSQAEVEELVLQESDGGTLLEDDWINVEASPTVVSDDGTTQVIQIIHPDLLTSETKRFFRLVQIEPS